MTTASDSKPKIKILQIKYAPDCQHRNVSHDRFEDPTCDDCGGTANTIWVIAHRKLDS